MSKNETSKNEMLKNKMLKKLKVKNEMLKKWKVKKWNVKKWKVKNKILKKWIGSCKSKIIYDLGLLWKRMQCWNVETDDACNLLFCCLVLFS